MQNIPLKPADFCNDTLWCFGAFEFGGFWFDFFFFFNKFLLKI